MIPANQEISGSIDGKAIGAELERVEVQIMLGTDPAQITLGGKARQGKVKRIQKATLKYRLVRLALPEHSISIGIPDEVCISVRIDSKMTPSDRVESRATDAAGPADGALRRVADQKDIGTTQITEIAVIYRKPRQRVRSGKERVCVVCADDVDIAGLIKTQAMNQSGRVLSIVRELPEQDGPERVPIVGIRINHNTAVGDIDRIVRMGRPGVRVDAIVPGCYVIPYERIEKSRFLTGGAACPFPAQRTVGVVTDNEIALYVDKTSSIMIIVISDVMDYLGYIYLILIVYVDGIRQNAASFLPSVLNPGRGRRRRRRAMRLPPGACRNEQDARKKHCRKTHCMFHKLLHVLPRKNPSGHFMSSTDFVNVFPPASRIKKYNPLDN